MATIKHIKLIQARIICLLPKNIHPSKKSFEDLGFVFENWTEAAST